MAAIVCPPQLTVNTDGNPGNLADTEWQMIVNTGANVSIACPIEMEMGHGVPPIQQALDHGIRPSLSADVETEIPSEFFTQMRVVFTLQRVASDALCTWPLPVLIRDFAQGGGCGVGKRTSQV